VAHACMHITEPAPPPSSPPRPLHTAAPRSLEVFVLEPQHEWTTAARKMGVGSAAAAARLAGGGGGAGGSPAVSDDSSVSSLGLDAALDAGAESWLPRARLLVAQLKLSRVNPCSALLVDLMQNTHYCPPRRNRTGRDAQVLMASCKAVVTADGVAGPHPRRERDNNQPYPLTKAQARLLEAATSVDIVLPAAVVPGGGRGGSRAAPGVWSVEMGVCGSVEAQVECMLDLATDANVLCRAWQGLATWV
jgi:hypothetical protein